MNKKVLILGKSGQLGQEIVQLFLLDKTKKYELMAPEEKDADITIYTKLKEIVLAAKPDVIVNCAAYTNVDKAEVEKEKAVLVNAYGTANIAEAALAANAVLIHISTDYVYDGKFDGDGFGFSHKTHFEHEKPLNNYGVSKLLGEEYLQDTFNKAKLYDYFILRTSGVYGIYGNHFLKKIETALETDKDKVFTLIADQKYCPTSARQLAKQIKTMVDLSQEDREYVINRVGNVLNAANLTYESPYLFFEKYMLMQKKYDFVRRIEPTSFDEYFLEHPASAKRPKNCPLDNELKRVLDLCEITDTEKALEEYIETKKKLEK